jgi:hypothetical protein
MMKKVILVFTSLALLLCAEALTLMVRSAADKTSPLKLDNIGFYYKQDEHARFMDLKTQWQTTHRSELPYSVARQLALKAYNKANIEALISSWHYDSGLFPNIITGKASIHNPDSSAKLDIPVSVILQAKTVTLEPTVLLSTQMTNLNDLQSSAHWVTLSKKNFTLPVIAPGEDVLVPLVQFSLMAFKQQHPHQWPLKLRVRFNSTLIGKGQQEISLTPDYFVMPSLY